MRPQRSDRADSPGSGPRRWQAQDASPYPHSPMLPVPEVRRLHGDAAEQSAGYEDPALLFFHLGRDQLALGFEPVLLIVTVRSAADPISFIARRATRSGSIGSEVAIDSGTSSGSRLSP